MARREVASICELEKLLTRILRGEESDKTTVGEKLKAIELLGKSFGMFTREKSDEAEPSVLIIDDLSEYNRKVKQNVERAN